MKDQCSNDEEEKKKNKEDDDKDNTSRADACLIVASVLLCFAAYLCATLAEAEWT